MERTLRLISIAVFLLMAAFLSAAEAPEADAVMRGFYDLKKADNSRALATMVLIDKRGGRKIRRMRMLSRETPRGTDSFIEFLEPADVKGTKFLTLGNKEGDDEQRLYLPALNKVRKITSSGKKGRFMGSDLYFYDMEDRDFSDASYRYLGEEAIAGRDSWVIELIPRERDAPYSRTVAWVAKEDSFIYQRKAYDKKGKLLKTIVMVEVRKVEGVLIPVKIAVENHQDQHKTLLQLSDLQVNSGIPEAVFTIQNLER